jgi:hypothetical protein
MRNAVDGGPLTWLHQRRDKNGNPLISAAERDAGERLAADFHAANLNPQVTASWDGLAAEKHQRRGPPAFAMEMSERVLAAKLRFDKALKAVGSEHADILIEVCCFERGLTEIEQRAGWPQRSGKVVLSRALRELARHYGLIRDETRDERPARIRGWAGPDARPKI